MHCVASVYMQAIKCASVDAGSANATSLAGGAYGAIQGNGEAISDFLSSVFTTEKNKKKPEPKHVDLATYMVSAGLKDAPAVLWPKSEVCDEVESEREKLTSLGVGPSPFVYTDLKKFAPALGAFEVQI